MTISVAGVWVTPSLSTYFFQLPGIFTLTLSPSDESSNVVTLDTRPLNSLSVLVDTATAYSCPEPLKSAAV